MLDARTVESGEPRHLIVVHDLAQTLALDSKACIEILDESGFMPKSGCVVVDLGDIPDGLDAAGLEAFLRREGGRLVGPNVHRNRQ
jgi:hypothetical protein